jgi:cysteine synthase A
VIYQDISQTIGRTPVVRINRLAPSHVTMYVKIEAANPGGSVKDRLALGIIEDAERRGLLKPGDTVVEATSGNTGIALALVCAARGYFFVAVMPESFSVERRQIMRAYGAKVILTPAAERASGAVRLAEQLAKERGWFLARQFENEANPAYHRQTTGPEILSDFASSRLDYWITGWGTGGTLTGAGRAFHAHDAAIKVVAAEPELGDLVYGLRSLDEGFIPPIFDPEQIDRKILVNSSDSLRATRELTAKEGIFAGISGGAVVHVAQRVALEIDEGDVVCLLADGGWKYLSTDAWAEDVAVAEKGVEESLWW